jgi:hypothetical protein
MEQKPGCRIPLVGVEILRHGDEPDAVIFEGPNVVQAVPPTNGQTCPVSESAGNLISLPSRRAMRRFNPGLLAFAPLITSA